MNKGPLTIELDNEENGDGRREIVVSTRTEMATGR